MQLTEWQAEFEALGVRIAAMSYDGVEVLADFATGNEIGYALLSDKGAKHSTRSASATRTTLKGTWRTGCRILGFCSWTRTA